MIKLFWMHSTVLFTVLIPLFFPTYLSEAFTPKTIIIGQDNPPPKSRPGGSRLRNNQPPKSRDGGSRSWEQTLNDVLLNNQPPESRDGGSRGRFCALTPMDVETGIKLWNDQPIFAWNGSITRLELRNHNGEALLWSQTVSESDRSIPYTDKPLEAGEKYTLWLYTSTSFIPDYQVIFQLLETEEKNTISQEIEQLESSLNTSNDEEIAQARFQYFADKQLWSDAISQPFFVQNPSESLNQFRKETLPKQFCN
jgi:hypothetical protein